MTSQQHSRPEAIEPEVLPPESGGPRTTLPPHGVKGRLTWILIGLLLDALDFMTMGPLGIRAGFLAGFFAAFGLLSWVRIPLKRRLLYSLAAGIYCTIPGTEGLPLGTLLAALIKIR